MLTRTPSENSAHTSISTGVVDCAAGAAAGVEVWGRPRAAAAAPKRRTLRRVRCPVAVIFSLLPVRWCRNVAPDRRSRQLLDLPRFGGHAIIELVTLSTEPIIRW